MVIGASLILTLYLAGSIFSKLIRSLNGMVSLMTNNGQIITYTGNPPVMWTEASRPISCWKLAHSHTSIKMP